MVGYDAKAADPGQHPLPLAWASLSS